MSTYLKLFMECRRMGVTQITLTEEALERVNEELKGLFKPTEYTREELEEIDAGWSGTLQGIRFYREI